MRKSGVDSLTWPLIFREIICQRRPGGELPGLTCEPNSGRLSSRAMEELTNILNAISEGDPQAASQLLPLVYNELRAGRAKAQSRSTGANAGGHGARPRSLLATDR